MSGPPRVKSMSFAESESRPVLGPAGNKARTMDTHKQFLKPLTKVEKPSQEIDDARGKKAPSLVDVYTTPSPPKQPSTAVGHCFTVPSILRQQEQKLLKSNLSLDASCSSDASSDSAYSRASTGRIGRRNLTLTRIRRKQSSPKLEKVGTDTDSGSVASADDSPAKKRCAWVTPNTGMFIVCCLDPFTPGTFLK
ncbi:DNA-3-methyladenine glycosylase I [Sarracenia purpurea var. burkii]